MSLEFYSRDDVWRYVCDNNPAALWLVNGLLWDGRFATVDLVQWANEIAAHPEFYSHGATAQVAWMREQFGDRFTLRRPQLRKVLTMIGQPPGGF